MLELFIHFRRRLTGFPERLGVELGYLILIHALASFASGPGVAGRSDFAGTLPRFASPPPRVSALLHETIIAVNTLSPFEANVAAHAGMPTRVSYRMLTVESRRIISISRYYRRRRGVD